MDSRNSDIRVCPRCDICGRVVRVRGIGNVDVWCTNCLSRNLPFVNIESEGNYRGALREFREGLGTGIGNFEGARFDPFGEEERGVLERVDGTLRGCKYTSGEKVLGRLKDMGKLHGCSLSLLFHNIRSARGPGLELLEGETRSWGVNWDVVGLAETWLDEVSEKYLSFGGFSAVCASRKHKTGGGVALLVREGITYRERPELSVFIEGVLESVFIEIVRTGEGKRKIVGVIYRPPGGNLNEFNSKLDQVLSQLRGTEAYIMGDYNIDLLKSDYHGPTTDCLEGFYARGFYPLVSLPSRLTDTSATLIDNVFTNNLLSHIESGLVTVRVSDHLPVFCLVGGEVQCSSGQSKEGWHRVVNERRIAQFREKLQAWSFDESRALGVEANIAKFRNEFRDMYDLSFPWAKNKKRARDEEKPWLDDEGFKRLVKEKGQLYSKKIKGTLGDEGMQRLAELNKEVNATRQRLKRAYFAQRMEDIKGDLHATWEVLGEVLRGRVSKRGSTACRYFVNNGVGITEGQEIVKGFCDFYCKVGPELAAKIWGESSEAFRDYLGDKVEETLYWRPTTCAEIEEICLGLKSNKGAGWDGVSPRVIKASAREIGAPLSQLYNYCLRSGHYPSCFKVARVVPVFKSEDPTQFSNYRPVSVLPVLSQIFERIINLRLVKFFEEQKVIIPGQYGFRSGHSTAMAIVDMVEKVRGAWAKKEVALGVFIDLKKAFDTVDHEILLMKLEHYGIRGVTLELIRSYLKDRTQYVCYGGYESEPVAQRQEMVIGTLALL